MKRRSTPGLRPFRPISPGELIKEELEARRWNTAFLSGWLGADLQTVEGIIDGKKRITARSALALSRALGTSREYWLNLESAYRADLRFKQRSIDLQD